jgi:hypothetical protein
LRKIPKRIKRVAEWACLKHNVAQIWAAGR